MADETLSTSFSTIYDSFLARVTSDMYMELTPLDTTRLLQELLINSLHWFEFPRFDIFDYSLGELKEEEVSGLPTAEWVGGFFNAKLTQEEINILSVYMVVEWLGQQLASTENTRIQYTGSDYKMTSQANHMAKIKVLVDKYQAEGFHLQRLYKRRKVVDGKVQSTIGSIMSTPSYGYNI